MHTLNTNHDETLKEFRIAINQLVDDDNMPEVLALIDKDRERAVLTAQIGMIEYYDQVTNNKDMDWKGLFADNRKALEYDLSKLQSPNKREDSDE